MHVFRYTLHLQLLRDYHHHLYQALLSWSTTQFHWHLGTRSVSLMFSGEVGMIMNLLNALELMELSFDDEGPEEDPEEDLEED